MEKRVCPNCGSDDITVTSPLSASGTDFWDCAVCNNCGFPHFEDGYDDEE